MMLLSIPPRTIGLATGGLGGAYYEFGTATRDELARANVEVRVMQTADRRRISPCCSTRIRG